MHIPHEVGADVVRYDERRALHDVRRAKSPKWHKIDLKRRLCLLVAWCISPSKIFLTTFYLVFVARYHYASVDIEIMVRENWLPLVKRICRFFHDAATCVWPKNTIVVITRTDKVVHCSELLGNFT